MSFNAAAPVVYKKGFRKPSGDRPFAMRASLIRAIPLAKIGDEQLVPSTVSKMPLLTISTFIPMAATSGIPRPEALYLSLYVGPRVLMKAWVHWD